MRGLRSVSEERIKHRHHLRRFVGPLLSALLVLPLLLGSGAVESSTANAATTTSWQQLCPSANCPTSPTARGAASMAYDPATGNVVLFGGHSGFNDEGDTWTWDGTTWTQACPSSTCVTSPFRRSEMAMAYDPATRQVLLFGGRSSTDVWSDLWAWNGATWTEVCPSASCSVLPSGVDGASMTYDAATGDMVVFGGNTSMGGDPDNSTWTWNGTQWTKACPSATCTTSPPARAWAGMAYDPATGDVVLDGGSSGADTWLWNGSRWTKACPATACSSVVALYSAGAGPQLAYDPAAGQVISVDPEGDTWGWTGQTWTQLCAPGTCGPPERRWASLAYDGASHQMLMYGGLDPSTYVPLGDTWELQTIPVVTVTPGQALTGAEGSSLSPTLATVSDSDTSATAGSFLATVNWGDGTSGAATVSGADGSFSISGDHTYAEEGPYSVTIDVTDPAGKVHEVTTTATVADAPLSASGIDQLLSTSTLSGTVATFTDANPDATAADFTSGGGAVTISWGDGTVSAGTVTKTASGTFAVGGSHEYSTLGPEAITVSITDAGGSSTSARSKALIYGTPSGGTFVVGDNSAAQGGTVTFWGPSWAEDNSLSGGSAPPAFKGFAPGAPASCNATWSAPWSGSPGASSPPPADPLPSYMAVAVTSSVAQSSATISGNAVHVVIVETDPGYAPDPGNAGTATVVAVDC